MTSTAQSDYDAAIAAAGWIVIGVALAPTTVFVALVVRWFLRRLRGAR
jgi:hypothetical protein